MPATEAQVAANRLNAQKSTGPKTPEGKARSRANALKHGLCSSVVVTEDAELVQQRAEEFFYTLKPQNYFHCWLVDQAALSSVRLDRSQRIERRIRDKVALRAELTWDDDRRLEAEVVGGMLHRQPAETVETLRRSPQGCDWLIGRWAQLAHAADSNPGGWTEEQATMAFDLRATPAAFRVGRKPIISIDDEGRVVDAGDDLAGFARREIAALKERRAVVSDLDEVERALTSVDLTNDTDPELRRLRRYENALHKDLRWAVSQIQHENTDTRSLPGMAPRWREINPTPKPEPKTEDEKLAEVHPKSSIHPPFCLDDDEIPEPGEKADIPMILSARKHKRLAKARARREARQRRVDRLRG